MFSPNYQLMYAIGYMKSQMPLALHLFTINLLEQIYHLPWLENISIVIIF